VLCIPKNNFEKHVLAEIWVAQGFVQHQLTTVACQYFEELVSRSFFQRAPYGLYTYVIHDLMHDMTQLVSSDECFIIRDASDLRRIPPNVHHLSIVTTSIFCEDLGPVHLAYNPSYSACFFSRNSIFLSQKSANSVFRPAYNSSRTAP
jgi:hypothetical protein